MSQIILFQDKDATPINILFIYPNTFGMNMLPPAIALFNALLKQHGHNVRLFDATYYSMDYGVDSDGSKADNLNVASSSYNSYRILAHSIFPPMHLNAFSTTNILHFSLKNGFNLLELTTPGRLDVDMVTITSDFIEDRVFKEVSKLDDMTKGLLQKII